MITFRTASFATLVIVAFHRNIVQCGARSRPGAYDGKQLQKTYGRISDRHLFSDNIRLHKLMEPKIRENYAKKEEQQEDHLVQSSQPHEQELYQSGVPVTPEDPVETRVSTRNVDVEQPDLDILFESNASPRKRKTVKNRPKNGYSINKVVKVEDSATYEEFAANYLKQLQDLDTKIETDFAPSHFILDPRTHVFRNTPNKHGQATFHSIQDIINSADDPNFHLYANHNLNSEPDIVVPNSMNTDDRPRSDRPSSKRPHPVNSLSFQPTKPLRTSAKNVNTGNVNKKSCSESGCFRRPVNGKRLVSGRSPNRGRRRRPNVIVTRTTL